MKTVLIVIACLIGIALVGLLLRSRIALTHSVVTGDIPEIVSQLQRSAKDAHFVVLMFVPPGSTDGEAINLQYSIEDGVIGLDWVLLDPRNIADKEKVSEFASKLGYRFEEHEENKVHYLRVTGGDISGLGISIIRDFYKMDPNTKLEMITEGFQWQPPAPKHRIE